jgi:hypothetical protein
MTAMIWLVALVASGAAQTTTASPPPAIQFSETSPEAESRNQPVTAEDLRILQRADQILSSPAVWNRRDTRTCKPADRTWSLFCALEKASLDVLGEYRHREVALQEVRFAIVDATNGRRFEHRLMDYNNLPSTSFDDIKRVVKVATDRVNARLTSRRQKP